MSNLQIWEESAQPDWIQVLYELAKDMRFDVDEKLINRLWKEKLKRYPDGIICRAILAGDWKVFPNVNEVIEEIKLIADQEREEQSNREWESYKAKQKAAAEQGLLATDADYAEMNAALKKLAQSMPRPQPAAMPKVSEDYTPPPPDELHRRKQEQLRAVLEKYGKAR